MVERQDAVKSERLVSTRATPAVGSTKRERTTATSTEIARIRAKEFLTSFANQRVECAFAFAARFARALGLFGTQQARVRVDEVKCERGAIRE